MINQVLTWSSFTGERKPKTTWRREFLDKLKDENLLMMLLLKPNSKKNGESLCEAYDSEKKRYMTMMLLQ